MKLNGKKLVNTDHIVGPFTIQRTIIDEDSGKPKPEFYDIFARPVWTYAEFDRLYPLPDPPSGGWSPSGKKDKNTKDPQYQQDIEEYADAREGWTIMKSIAEASKLEVDGIDMQDPSTWAGILNKLRGGVDGSEGVFTVFEYNKIVEMVDEACGIDDAKVEANRKTFLSEQQARILEQTKL